jgi:cytochrome b561
MDGARAAREGTALTARGLHQAMEWTLLAVIGIHVAVAMVHIFIYRDRIMQRMLPG